jgi:hypothetical protein
MTENTCEYFMDNLVDYSDKTPNEPRYNKDGTLDEIVYYPLGNIYYNHHHKILMKIPHHPFKNEVDQEWFLDRLHESQIRYAIEFLQVGALKKYIIKNYKSVIFTNPFYYLYKTFYPIDNDKNMDSANEIIKILIDNYDDYYELITRLPEPYKNLKYVQELLYSFLPNDDDNLCQICLQTGAKERLINCCSCKTKTHVDCFVKLNDFKLLAENKCSVCLCNYKINEPVIRTMSGVIIKPEAQKLFFPYHDFYYKPLMSNSGLIKYDGMERLTMAIVYLQVERVKQLLQEKEVLEQLILHF